MQQEYIKILEEAYGDHIPLVHVPEFALEVKGVDRIGEVSEILFAAPE
jgi:hypothetical protein